MIRPVYRGALAVIPLATLGLIGASVDAQQAMPSTAHSPDPRPIPIPAQQMQPSQTQAPQTPASLPDLNPAARRYGLVIWWRAKYSKRRKCCATWVTPVTWAGLWT